MADLKIFYFVIYYWVLLSTCHGGSSDCANCSIHLDFSVWKLAKSQKAEFRLLTLTDQKTECTLDFGDNTAKTQSISPGLTNKIVLHVYLEAGRYKVVCKCRNATKSVFVLIESDIQSKFKAEYKSSRSVLNLKLDVDEADCSHLNKCQIVFNNTDLGFPTVQDLRNGYILSFALPGYHKLGLTCKCITENLYKDLTVQVYDPCFKKAFFPFFPPTSLQKPFVFYKESHLVFKPADRIVSCNLKETRRQWVIKKSYGNVFQTVNWTFSDNEKIFPDNVPFGLYSIELTVSADDRSQSETIYVLYKETIRPLLVYGGSIQYVKANETVRLMSESINGNYSYYLWCYHKNTNQNFTNSPLWKVNLEGKMSCEPFTTKDSFELPVNLTGQFRFLQVFGFSETEYVEGRSFLIVTTSQEKMHTDTNIRCIYNCYSQISTLMNLVLRLEIFSKNIDENSTLYQWTVFKAESNLYTQFTSPGNWSIGEDTPALTILGDTLPTNTWIKICANFNASTTNGFVCNEIFCGLPPSKGKCDLSSTNGIALETRFSVNCMDYEDDGIKAFRNNVKPSSIGLRYAIMHQSGDNLAVIYYGCNPKIGPFSLGIGDDADKSFLSILVFDLYYSYTNETIEMTVTKPATMNSSFEGIEEFLLDCISEIDHLPRQDQFNIMNSVSGVINKMKTESLLQKINYNVKDMVNGTFIDFDLEKDIFRDWYFMESILLDESHMKNIELYSGIIEKYVEQIGELVRDDYSVVEVLSALGTLNLAVSYHPYVSETVMKQSVNISAFLLRRALDLCRTPVISIFMTKLADCGEALLGRLMSVINTDQIVLASQGFSWDTVRKYMEMDQMYVEKSIIERASMESTIDEFERFYLLQKTYLLSNVGINKKREQAAKLSVELVGHHLQYMEELINNISISGRKCQSKTGTCLCSEKTTGKKSVKGVGCGQLDIEASNRDFSPSEGVKDVEVMTTKEHLYTFDKDMRSSLITKPTIVLKMGENGTKNRPFTVKFEAQASNPIEIAPNFIPGDQSRLFYHKFLYRSNIDFACIRLTPTTLLGYEIYFRLNAPPNNDSFHYRTAVSLQNQTDGYYQICVPPDVFKTNGSLYVGIRPFHLAGVRDQNQTLLAPYFFDSISSNCLVWDGTEWITNACQLIWKEFLACECSSNKQITVSSTFSVTPNIIDFTTVFTKFDIINNGTVFSVVLGIFLLFVIFLVIALKRDRKEERRDCFCYLVDNYKEDSYYYLLVVYTGLKVGAGTHSNICFVLSGEKGTSGVRSLSDEAHEGFKSGSVRKFVMSVPGNLGDLIYLKIWTDASGKGENSSWFLDRFDVMDIENERKFTFRCNAWLTTDDNNGRSHYILPCNRFHDEMTFACRFKENMYNSMTDGHLWFSSYMRPCYNQFTRAQRTTCCTLVLYLTMIVNAMFYRSAANLVKPDQFSVGPLRFSLSQIAISLQSIAITLPPTFLVLFFFRNSRPPKYKPTDQKEQNEVEQNGNTRNQFLADPHEFPGNGFLPHWCTYIGWAIAFLTITASGFFVILFSMQWGKTKSEEWLTTFLLTSSESIFFVDPIKIFLVAFMIAFLRKSKREFKLTYFDQMSILQEIHNSLYETKDPLAKYSIFPPLGRRDVLKRREQVQHEKRSKSILLNFVLYSLLLWSATSIAFVNRSKNAFAFKDHLEQTFANPIGSPVQFSKINSVASFYNWTQTIVYPALFPKNDIRGRPLFWIDKKYIKDGINIKIGPMRLRQLRIKAPEICKIHDFTGIKDCYPNYSFSKEDENSYCIGWKESPDCGLEMVYNETLVAWSYTPPETISGLPLVGIYNMYGGGGYIMNMQVNTYIANRKQEELLRAKWIDRRTRAVFLEFTLYNANSNQFANIFFLVEFPETGGAIPYHQIHVVTVYDSAGSYTIACLTTFVLCLAMFTIKNLYNLFSEQKRFFKNFWHIVDLCAFLTTISACVAFTKQYFGTRTVMEQFRRDPRIFVNFFHLIVWNQIVTYNLAVQIFFTIIRVSCVLGFSRRMVEIAGVIKRCASEMLGVFCIFAVYAMAFIMVGNLCFTTTSPYRSYPASLTSVLLLLLGKTSFDELTQVSPVFGRVYLVLEIFFMIFIILKMFESVLSDSISSKNKSKQQNSLLDHFMGYLQISRKTKMSNPLKK